MAEKTLATLFEDTLKDVYFAERKILSALPKMAKAAQSQELKDAFHKHHSQTEEQVRRLEQVFGLIGQKAKGKTCPAILGILEEGTEMMEEYQGSPALDAALISAAQAVEHYEIARYGTLKRWANDLGLAAAVELLDETLQEEGQTDKDLTALADDDANEVAMQAAA
jgi:ferritin-like metal-binding protein YciE